MLFQQTGLTLFLPGLLSLEIKKDKDINLILKQIASFRRNRITDIPSEDVGQNLGFFLNRCLHDGPFQPLAQPRFSGNGENSFLDARPGFG